MTTHVMIASPSNSLHGLLVWTEKCDADGTWSRVGEAVAVASNETAEPLYADARTRFVVEEATRATADNALPGIK
jgi:hypothetical protein